MKHTHTLAPDNSMYAPPVFRLSTIEGEEDMFRSNLLNSGR